MRPRGPYSARVGSLADLRSTPSSVLDVLAAGPPDACWPWPGEVDAAGFPRVLVVDVNGHTRRIGAHRVAWFVTYGSVPDSLVVSHRCELRACINPAHLELLPQRDAVARRGGDASSLYSFAGGTCQYGHDVTDPAAVYVRPDGRGSMCRECQRDRVAAYRQRIAGAAS